MKALKKKKIFKLIKKSFKKTVAQNYVHTKKLKFLTPSIVSNNLF